MPPIWIKPHTERHKAYQYTLEKCGVSDKDATLVLNEAFRGYRDALQMHSLPDSIDFGLFKLKVSRFKVFLRMMKYGIWWDEPRINYSSIAHSIILEICLLDGDAMTDYEFDKEYEKSEWWRVPVVLAIVPSLIFIYWMVSCSR